MLELIFVIVVMGILAAAIIPSTRTNPLQEAAIQVLSHIRYVQHLAMVDDKYDAADSNWYRARWQIYFKHDSGDVVYSIYSNKDLDDMSTSTNPDAGEIAKDPMSSKDLTGDSMYSTTMINSMNLSRKYGISITDMNTFMSDGCNQKRRLFFDHLGRPLLRSNTSAYEELLTSNCTITLVHSDGSDIKIKIEPETGFSCILNASGICI
jgi:type II secretory pathway pseudopilin PulG